jgi:hypothetical protein
MKRNAFCGFIALLLLIDSSASCQSASVHAQIQEIYNFQPHLLSRQEQTQRSALLDQFWTRARAERTTYISALRLELADFRNPSFFLYDGSMLLLSLSDTSEDRKIVLAAIAHCDLRDVQENDYFLKVHHMATLNENTTAAAFHILEQPDFKVFIPQHSLTLGQNYVLIYLLLPASQDYWLQPAIDRLKAERDPTAQKSRCCCSGTHKPMQPTRQLPFLPANPANLQTPGTTRETSCTKRIRSVRRNALKTWARRKLRCAKNGVSGSKWSVMKP